MYMYNMPACVSEFVCVRACKQACVCVYVRVCFGQRIEGRTLDIRGLVFVIFY